MNHAKALGIATAYDMHIECAEGNLNPDWKLDKPVDFHRFREKLGMQMLKYDPRERMYPGDEKFRVSTQQNQAQRRRTTSPSRSSSPDKSIRSTSSGVCEDDLSSNTDASRLCGFLDPLIEHIESVKRFPGTNGRVCVVCGARTAKCCGKCDKAMHMSPPDDVDSKVTCFMHYHNTGFFGLARDDCRMVRRKQKDWSFPSIDERKANSREMKIIHKRHRDKMQPNSNDNADNEDTNSSSRAEN